MSIKDLLVNGSEVKDDRKKPSKILIATVFIALIILIFGNFFEHNDDYDVKTASSQNFDICDYTASEEQRLGTILKKINGAGNVSVYISIENGGEKILARNIKSDTSKDGASVTDKNFSEREENESTVAASGKEDSPYVVKETTPQVSGVLVVAEGASSEKVRLEIYDAVKALYGIPAHRIKVAY